MASCLKDPAEFTEAEKEPSTNEHVGTPSLTGTWEAVSEHILEEGEWVLNFLFNPGDSWCEFSPGGQMTEYYHGEKIENPYVYDPATKELSANDTVSMVQVLTATELVISHTAGDIPPVIYKTTYRRN